MRIDVVHRAAQAGVAMEVDMADVEMGLVSVQAEIDMCNRASLVCVLVGMRVRMATAVTVRVGVHCVGVVVVSGPIRVRNIRVILVARICVIAMVVVEVVAIGHIQMVVVLGLVEVIPMPHIPEVPVRRLLGRVIQVARAGEIGMIRVGRCI